MDLKLEFLHTIKHMISLFDPKATHKSNIIYYVSSKYPNFMIYYVFNKL